MIPRLLIELRTYSKRFLAGAVFEKELERNHIMWPGFVQNIMVVLTRDQIKDVLCIKTDVFQCIDVK